MDELFEHRNIQYNLGSQTDFQLGSVKKETMHSDILIQKYGT